MRYEEEENIEPLEMKKYIAELIGTFVLVFIGCGSAVIAGGQIGFLGISLAFGFAVLVMVYAIGPISGCHINPAITIAMLAAGKIKMRDAGIYIVMQIIGAILAAGALWGIASGLHGYELSVNGLGQNYYGDKTVLEQTVFGYNWFAAFLAEVILTAIFLLVIFGATSEKAPKGFAGLAIGVSLAIIHMVGIPITGTSVNPARSIGPAVFVGNEALEHLWLFIVAPIIGALIAAGIWKYLLEEQVEEAEELPMRGGRRMPPPRAPPRYRESRF